MRESYDLAELCTFGYSPVDKDGCNGVYEASYY